MVCGCVQDEVNMNGHTNVVMNGAGTSSEESEDSDPVLGLYKVSL